MIETRLPSRDPLSTRTRPGEGPWDTPEAPLDAFADEESPPAGTRPSVVLIDDSDLRR